MATCSGRSDVQLATPSAAACVREAFALEPRNIPTTLDGFYYKALARVANASMLPELAQTLDRDANFDVGVRHRTAVACLGALSELQDASFVFGGRVSATKTATRRPTISTKPPSSVPVTTSPPFETAKPPAKIELLLADDEDDIFSQASRTHGSKKRAQRAVAASTKTLFDERPFRALRLSPPSSRDEAEVTAFQVMAMLKDQTDVRSSHYWRTAA